jgi:hypothetical protein
MISKLKRKKRFSIGYPGLSETDERVNKDRVDPEYMRDVICLVNVALAV